MGSDDLAVKVPTLDAVRAGRPMSVAEKCGTLGAARHNRKCTSSSGSAKLPLTSGRKSPLYAYESNVNRSTFHQPARQAERGLEENMVTAAAMQALEVPRPTLQEVFEDFLVSVSRAATLIEVNIAAGIAAELVQQLTT
jgi:hypothetical protein